MKKLLYPILFLSAILLIAPKAHAQSPVSVGIRGGLNFATLNNVDNADTRVGFSGGVFANFRLPASPVSIQPEVLYTQKGAKTSESVGSQNFSTTTKLDYLEIPVLAKFDYILDGPVTPHVYFGPYVGFNINAEQKKEASGSSGTSDINDSVKDTDFGVVVGGGVTVSKIDIGIRYGAGLTKIAEDGSDGKNGVFSIVAGIHI